MYHATDPKIVNCLPNNFVPRHDIICQVMTKELTEYLQSSWDYKKKETAAMSYERSVENLCKGKPWLGYGYTDNIALSKCSFSVGHSLKLIEHFQAGGRNSANF